MKDYKDDLKIVYKNYVVHPNVATDPALASCAAGKQGKFPEMEHLIWEKGYNANRNLSASNMETLAKEAGLNMDQYKKDIAGACQETLKTERQELSKFGVSGTPAFFINGRFLSGARPIDQFKKVIDEELKKASEAIANGTSVENYYSEYVEKKGMNSLK